MVNNAFLHPDKVEGDADGYLTDATIQAVHDLTFDAGAAAYFLARGLPYLVSKLASSVSVTVKTVKDACGQDVVRIEYHTGGWSSAEELIESCLAHFWVRYYYSAWRRGGHHVFDVPAVSVETTEARLAHEDKEAMFPAPPQDPRIDLPGVGPNRPAELPHAEYVH